MYNRGYMLHYALGSPKAFFEDIQVFGFSAEVFGAVFIGVGFTSH